MNLNKNKKRKDPKSRGTRINKTVVLLVLFCLCIGGISMIYAKYIKQNTTNNNSATAKEFYFESDLLDGKEHEIKPTEDDKTASVMIRLKNYIDELRYSETAIDYTVSVTEGDSQATGVTVDQPTGTINAGTKSHADVKLSNLQPGHTYTVKATTDNIYKKTLTGTIKVSKIDDQVYASVHDETQYIEVTIWTTDHSGEVKLSYGNIGLIPDNTDTKMKDAQSTGGTITESDWKANTSHVFRFFKETISKTYQTKINGTEVTISEK